MSRSICIFTLNTVITIMMNYPWIKFANDCVVFVLLWLQFQFVKGSRDIFKITMHVCTCDHVCINTKLYVLYFVSHFSLQLGKWCHNVEKMGSTSWVVTLIRHLIRHVLVWRRVHVSWNKIIIGCSPCLAHYQTQWWINTLSADKMIYKIFVQIRMFPFYQRVTFVVYCWTPVILVQGRVS